MLSGEMGKGKKERKRGRKREFRRGELVSDLKIKGHLAKESPRIGSKSYPREMRPKSGQRRVEEPFSRAILATISHNRSHEIYSKRHQRVSRISL